MRKHLDSKGIAVRRCDTFVGLDGAVPARGGAPRLADACRRDGRGAAVSAALSDIIEVLEAAYPPRLAQDWDSVGLVCGDPSETVESVTIAVDATAAVVAEMPDGRPAAGASSAAPARGRHRRRQHGQGRAATPDDPYRPGAVHRAHQRRRGVAGSVRCAGRRAGPDRRRSSRAGVRRTGPGQVGGVRACRKRRSGKGGDVRRRRRTHRRLLALQLERDGHRPVPAARRRVAGHRQRGNRRTGSRGSGRGHRPASAARSCARRDARRAPLRGAGIRHLRPGAHSRRCRTWVASARWRRPEPLSAFVSRVHDALPGTSWGVRASGDSEATVSRVAVCGGAGDSLLDAVADAGVQAYVTADLRHHPADEHRRASDVALIDVAHWASEFPWCTQAADVLRGHFGDSLPVRVSAVRTDPWNVERNRA